MCASGQRTIASLVKMGYRAVRQRETGDDMDRIDAMAASLRDLIRQGVDALQKPKPTTAAAGGELQDAEAHRFLALFETLYLVAAADQHLDDTERTEMIESMSNLVDGQLSHE